jgi:two-component system cell cycle sensor histidine kinase/response regulator CckA
MREKAVKGKNGSEDIDADLKYRTLFEQSPDGILLIDTSGNLVEFNEAAHTMLGYTRNEFASLRISDISTDSPEHIQSCIRRLLDHGRAELEAVYRTSKVDSGSRPPTR